MNDHQATFLAVEDNEIDFEKLQRGFSTLKITNPLVRAKDGIEALEILRATGDESQINGACIILLDLNMPRMNGIEFLEELRADPKLAHTAVYVMTTSDRPKDVQDAYDKNISEYILKPIDRQQMLEALNTLNLFWNLCEYPQAS